ncbi:hypothetical protein C0J29_27695 [Mycobacterium paragordonae]|uniref:pentapeptide repeat-containing protein n=1 Tax=Mycobacterium paragordonae TaxID=1389713 RepID=UPI000EA93260|nr:hypothetical protein C0J29_27695 [Mycobacterium paragordonae]TDK90944.1 hypothetical protein EUA02_22610 [Mycobacterium paragordonae]TDL03667.1 hypothetical protein EUA05_23720 [Mycobacterium paragordonae]
MLPSRQARLRRARLRQARLRRARLRQARLRRARPRGRQDLRCPGNSARRPCPGSGTASRSSSPCLRLRP